MRYPRGYCRMGQTLAEHFGHPRPAQWRGLALRVHGAVLQGSAR